MFSRFWKKSRNRATAPDIPLKGFVAEADRLVKPSTRLTFDGAGDPLGFWHGDASGTPLIIDGGPLLSVRHGHDWLTVYPDPEELEGGRVDVAHGPPDSGRPLYGTAAESLPPVEAVLLFGSDDLGRRLEASGWARDRRTYGTPWDRVLDQYEDLWWRKTCPVFRKDTVAALGGWHCLWPDDDWHELTDWELVVTTVLGAEPWVEVFHKDGRYRVIQRIT